MGYFKYILSFNIFIICFSTIETHDNWQTKQLKQVYIVFNGLCIPYILLIYIFYFSVICCCSPALDRSPFFFQTASHILLYVCGFNNIDYINEEIVEKYT